MKKCRYCGTPQSDERHTCVDCGKVLPKPLSAEEAEVIEDALDDRLDAMSDHTDVFCVSRADRILGIIAVVGLIASAILFCVSLTELNQIQNAWEEKLMQAIQSDDPFGMIDAAISAEPSAPTRKAYLEHTGQSTAVALLFYLVSAIYLLFPRAAWILGTLKYRLWYNYDPEPSAFAEWTIGFFKYGGFIIACIALVLGVWMYF